MIFNSFLRVISAGFASAMVGACTMVPGSTLLAMNRIDPLSVDPGDITVAVRAPLGYDLDDGRVVFSLALLNKETGEEIEVAEAMTLQDGAIGPALLQREKPGTRIWVFSVTPEQSDAIVAARETALAWETTGDQSRQMSIAVGALPCLAPGANPFQEPKYTIFMKSIPDGDWMTLVRESNFEDLARAANMEPFEIVPCESAP